MFENKILTYALMIFITSPLVLANSTDITLDCLADICEDMELAILDIVVEYETYNDPPPKLQHIAGTNMGIQKGRAKHVWSSARPLEESDPNKQKKAPIWRSKSTEKVTIMNGRGHSWDSEITQSYNGKVAKRHQLDGWPKRISHGTITQTQDFAPKRGITPFGFTILRFERKPLSKRLREKELVSIDNTIKTVNGFEIIHVDLFVPINNKKILSKRVYFSVDHCLTPVKIEYFNGRKVGLAVEVFELAQVAEALWFPKKGRLAPSTGRAYVYEASKVALNQGLTNDYFNIEFPPGTKVRDEIKGIEYIVKSK